jgi:6-phosphogluconate dehydrogenase
MGADGAGHYVKMVHNGIEYGDMQLICEAYAILSDVLGLSADELAIIFSEWNRGELNSYLIEITATILGKKDSQTGKPLVDLILDRAGQKGTGKWTVGHAVEMGVPLSTISAAVEARILSSLKEERVSASAQLKGPERVPFPAEKEALIEAVRDALYASKIVSYAQGFVQLGAAAKQYGWTLNFGDIATIWRGGCIIRAHFLNRIKQAYELTSSRIHSRTGAWQSEPLSQTESPCRHSVHRSLISTAIGPRVSRPTCCKPSATSSARTHTNAWTNPRENSFTRSGCNKPAPNRLKGLRQK